MQAAKRKSWLGELWRPLAALLLWAVGIVAAYAAPPLLPSLAETRIGGLTAFPVDCIPAVPLFSSDLTRACGPPLYDSASGCSVAAKSGPGKYTVGAYDDIRGTVPGLDAHHVGQKAVMDKFVPGYNPGTAPSILVPKVGHTIRGPDGIVSRSTDGFTNAREVVARDIFELRRVYPDVPNSSLRELIDMNKTMYPGPMTKP